jgi:threonine/homoserine/homoserine lactone efflux protein
MHALAPGAEAALLPLFAVSPYWFHLPVVIVVISLVYGATRFDDWPHILREARRWVVRLAGFLFVIVLVLYILATFI